jgi:hypothetical protein
MVNADRIIELVLSHSMVAVGAAAIWAFVSLCLIARLWVLHRCDRVIGKLIWSLVLCIPLFGWIFFIAFYRPPEALDWTGHAEHGRDAGYIGGGHL